MLMVAFALIVAALGASYWLTSRIRRYALAQDLLDVPNHRSSHEVPTPKGGGLAFTAVFFTVVLAFVWLLPQHRALWTALLGGVVVSLVGWLDDRRSLPARLRLLVHFLAALWALFWLGNLAPFETIGAVGSVLAVFGIVWSLNLYNFMDGIDGLAGGQAVITATAAGGFLLLAADAWPLTLACWVLAAAVGGFLCWNWPPAKIFMGDTGSCALGFIFAVFAIYTAKCGTLPLSTWAVLMSPFLVDATATLIYRLLKGEKWYRAHRSHAYQRALQRGHSHLNVTVGILLIDIALVVACCIFLHYTLPPTHLLLGALTFLLWLWWYLIPK